MKFKFIILLLLAGFISQTAHSQNKTFSNVKKISRTSIKAFKNDNKVLGYYSLFFLEKKDRKNNSYRMEIMDANLKTTHKINFSKSKKSYLLEGKFNGSHFCFTYVNTKEKSISNDIYDKKGKKTGTYTVRNLNKMLLNTLIRNASNDIDSYAGTLMDIGDNGFAVVYQVKKSGYKIMIDGFDNKGHKLWSVGSGVKNRGYEGFIPFYSSSEYLAGSLVTRKSAMSKKMTSEVLILNAKTGKTIKKLNTADKNSFLIVNGMDIDRTNGNIFIFGEKLGYKKGMPIYKDKKGMVVRILDEKGKPIKDHLFPWSSIRKKLSSKEKAKFNKDASNMIHKVVRVKDGKYYIIAEQFNKEASALGIAAKILSAGDSEMSVAKVVLYNMLVIQLNADFKLEKAKIIEKPQSNVFLPTGALAISETLLGIILKTYRQFDYSFTSINSDYSNFNTVFSCYNFKLGKKNRKNRYFVGAIALGEDDEIINTKINLSTKPTFLIPLPAKMGYINLYEYNRKKKAASMRLEKFDL